jgi:hypothetical protein
MASDDEFYYYDDDDGGDEEEEEAAAADWDGLALEADEDDLGLAEDDTPLRERRADCWVSIAARSSGLRARAGCWGRRLGEIGGFQPPRAPSPPPGSAEFFAPFFSMANRFSALCFGSLCCLLSAMR